MSGAAATVEIKWWAGPAVPLRREPTAKLDMGATTKPEESWVKKLMGMRNRGPLKDMVSAWGDHDTPDEVALSGREDAATKEGIERAHAEQVAWEQQQIARAEANRRQDELMAKLKAEREAEAMGELEQLDGYGSF